MPTERMLRQPVAPTRILHTPIVLQKMELMVVAPLFSSSEAQKLANQSSIIKSVDGKKWMTLEGWLDPLPGEDDVLCRKTGLQIELKRRKNVASSLQPLPLQKGLRAKLLYQVAGRGKGLAMEAKLDTRRGVLSLVLPFVEPDMDEAARRAALERYDEVLGALSSPEGSEVRLAYTHSYRVQEPNPQGGQRPDPRRPDPRRPDSQRPARRRRPARVAVRRPPTELRARPQVRPQVTVRRQPQPALTRQGQLNRQLTPEQLAKIRAHHVVIQPPATTTEKSKTLPGRLVVEVQRSRTHPSAFPDLQRAENDGWGQLPTKPSIYYRDTDLPDTFYFLPTFFKLGYHVERDGATGRPPLRPEFYRNGDDHRVKVTLVAVPGIDDADRAALAEHLRKDVLLEQVPFVRLVPASGLTTNFLPTFTTRGVDGQPSLPASILFQPLELDIDDRLLLEFDMGAAEYAIFSELLRKGLRGTAKISGKVHESIPVDLSLDEVSTICRVFNEPPADDVAPGIFVWLEEEESADETEPTRVRLRAANRLEHPVRLDSIHASLLDNGINTGEVFEVEEVEVSRGITLEAKGADGGGDLFDVPLAPRRLSKWDETVPRIGRIEVQGGTPQQWLDRIHEDPSLTQAEFVLRVERVSPVIGEDRLQLMRLRLFEEGSTAPREQLEFSTAESTHSWPITLSLKELAGDFPQLRLEYDCVTVDGEISLPQRVPVDPVIPSTLLLRPAISGPGTDFTLETGGEQEENLDLEAAAHRIQELRQQDAAWNLFVRRVEVPPEPLEPTPPDPVDTDPQPDPQEPVTTGTPVQIITDLLTAPFAAGELASVFVTLQPTGEGAQTTIAIEADQLDGHTWIPDTPDVPPFHYRVTYLFADSRPPRRVEGTEASPVLVLDPEA